MEKGGLAVAQLPSGALKVYYESFFLSLSNFFDDALKRFT